MNEEADVPMPRISEESESQIWTVTKGLVKSFAASFPVAASLGQACNEWEAYKVGERLKELQDNIVAELGRLRQKMHDIESCLQESADEFPALLEVTIEKVRRETQQEKRLLFARLMCGALAAGAAIPSEEKIALIQELETLTARDLSLVALFRDGKGRELKKLRATDLGFETKIEAFHEALVASVAKLEARGLMAGTAKPKGVHMLRGNDDQKPRNWDDLATTRTVWLLPFGVKLAELLRADVQQEESGGVDHGEALA
jgi:hypothetical protein